jgi:hypothetical protein
MSRRKRVFIYSDSPSPALSIHEVASFLVSLGVEVACRGDFIRFLSLDSASLSAFACRIAASRVYDISSPLDELPPPKTESVSYEHGHCAHPSGERVIYDALWLQRVLYTSLALRACDELSDCDLHLVFTGRLFGTFERRRYHARVFVGGQPSLISTSGLVEAPAKPREYYIKKAALISAGLDPSELDSLFAGRFLAWDDPLTTLAIRSYALQAIFYYFTGEEFCSNPSCCLFNSHWQEEVISAQVKGALCGECRSKLELALLS